MLPLLTGDGSRSIAWRHGRAVSLADFRNDVAALASRLAPHGPIVNLCEDRYAFLVSFTAALSLQRTSLLPPSRAEQLLLEIERAHPGSERIDDALVASALAAKANARALPTQIDSDFVALIGYTSGSTGQPKANAKRWRAAHGTSACNAAAMRAVLQIAEHESAWVLATVPSQHMYGMELSILLPLIGNMAVHSSRPLFPADIAAALSELPPPRVLVSTPVHLRAIIESGIDFPRASLVVSATAPLSRALAEAVEARVGPLLEMFGSTETCVIASRRTAVEAHWRAYEGIVLSPLESATRVDAPWFADSAMLQDVVELQAPDRFVVRGRHADMIEVAGKRASLADLTKRVLAIEGVRDAHVFQPTDAEPGAIARVAALVVAPTLEPRQILDALAKSVDPAFLPRPLVLVDSLPRNELGKLPREQVLAMFQRYRAGR